MKLWNSEMKLRYCFFALVISVFFCRNEYLQAEENTSKVIKIGVIAPLTGGLAERGDDIAKLLPLIKKEMQSTKLKHTYDFVIEDGKCGAGNAAITAAMKFNNIDNIRYLITGCSGETLQVGSFAQKNKIVTIAVLSLHPDIKKFGDYIFRTFIDIDSSIKKFTEHMASDCNDRIAILTEENAFTFGVRDMLDQHLGEKVVFKEDFHSDSRDFYTLLARMNTKKPECVYLNVLGEGTLINLVNQFKSRKLPQKIFSYVMPEAKSFRKSTDSNSDGLFFIGTPEIKKSPQKFQKIHDEYMELYPEGPSFDFILRTTYDAVWSIVYGIEAVGNDPEQVKNYLLDSYSKEGALGMVSYDKYGDIRNLDYVLKKIDNDGNIVFIKDLRE